MAALPSNDVFPPPTPPLKANEGFLPSLGKKPMVIIGIFGNIDISRIFESGTKMRVRSLTF